MENLTFGSLFTGIGGFDLAFERAGMKCVWQVEIDKYCQDVLVTHFPETEKFKDVKTVGKQNLKPVDVICGGFPCQDLSIAGKRAGLTGERSGLWWEFARIINELNPRWVVIENVPGILSSDRGRDFAIILRSLVEFRYGVSWRIFDAQYAGVPQQRRRIIIVGSFGNGSSAEILFESKSSRRNIKKGKKAWEDIARTITNRIGKGDFTDPVNDNIIASTVTAMYARNHGANAGNSCMVHNLIIWQMNHANEVYRGCGDISPTLQNRMGTGGNNIPLIGVRRLTPTECERLQGFPDGWTDNQSDTQRYKQLGNAVAVPVVEWIGKRIVESEEKCHDSFI